MKEAGAVKINLLGSLPRYSQTINELRCEAARWAGKCGSLIPFPGKLEITRSTKTADADSLWIEARIGSHPVAVNMTMAQAERLTGIPVELLKSDDVAPVFEDKISAWMNDFEDAHALGVQITGVSPDESIDKKKTFYAKVQLSDGRFSTHLVSFSNEIIAFLDKNLSHRITNSSLRNMLRVSCSFSVVVYAMTPSELRSLRPGDALYCYSTHTPTGWVSIGAQRQHGFSARLEDGKLIVCSALKETSSAIFSNRLWYGAEGKLLMNEKPDEDSVHTDDKNMDTPDETEPDMSIDTGILDPSVQIERSLSEVRLLVSAVVSEFTATIDELSALNEGDFLELPSAPLGRVDLVINGIKIGEAQFVHVGETMALEILSLNAK